MDGNTVNYHNYTCEWDELTHKTEVDGSGLLENLDALYQLKLLFQSFKQALKQHYFSKIKG